MLRGHDAGNQVDASDFSPMTCSMTASIIRKDADVAGWNSLAFSSWAKVGVELVAEWTWRWRSVVGSSHKRVACWFRAGSRGLCRLGLQSGL